MARGSAEGTLARIPLHAGHESCGLDFPRLSA